MNLASVLFVCIASFILSLVLVSIQIKKFKAKGLTATDYYKKDLRKVPTGGGISVLITLLLMFLIVNVLRAILQVPVNITIFDLASLITILLFGIFGLIDDFIVDVGKITKIILPIAFPLPFLFIVKPQPINLPIFGSLNLGHVYFLIFFLYIMVTSNLINMHSGFNGLAIGLSAIILFFILVKSIIHGCKSCLFTLSCIFGATLGLLWYNRYPSKIFEGNVGSLSIGAAIGIGIVTCSLYVSGFIMLIPHTVNFLMYVYWRIMHKLNPQDSRWRLVKFGKVREDGTLEVPNNLTLKWVLPYYYRITEKQAVIAMYILTLLFCIIAFFVPF